MYILICVTRGVFLNFQFKYRGSFSYSSLDFFDLIILIFNLFFTQLKIKKVLN